MATALVFLLTHCQSHQAWLPAINKKVLTSSFFDDFLMHGRSTNLQCGKICGLQLEQFTSYTCFSWRLLFCILVLSEIRGSVRHAVATWSYCSPKSNQLKQVHPKRVLDFVGFLCVYRYLEQFGLHCRFL